jgi:uncharacterized protein (DUF362 family)/Pyruvate/2-oxoacid:ferredoxin oxidoreductase delta subunit
MTKVVIKTSSYEYSVLKPRIFEMLDKFTRNSITPAAKVLIKPNLLAPARPEDAMITHPLVVKAAAEYVLSRGAKPVISDSQGMGTFNRVLRTGGHLEALEGLDVDFREPRKSVLVDIGEPFGKIEIAEDAMNADLIINLPKLKTHAQMLLTLGVKNLFGCIVGLRKPQWHFRTGVDREMFALLLVKIYAVIKPSVTILDGILAMEGQGPGRSGNPKGLNVLMGSDNAVALDMAVCRMLGLDPDCLLTNRTAIEMGLSDDFFEVEGALPLIKGFRMPLMVPLIWGPKRFHSVVRKHLVQRPVVNPSKCRSCGECWKICPAKAILPRHSAVVFDYGKCIRCYCCIEICPCGALKTAETLGGKLFRKLITS